MPLQYIKVSVHLRFVPCPCVLILRGVVVDVPVYLAHHRTEGGGEEGGPFVVVDEVLRGGSGGIGMEGVGGVVGTKEVVDAGSGFPGDNGGVGVFWSGC